MNIVEPCKEKEMANSHPKKVTLNVNPRLPSKSINKTSLAASSIVIAKPWKKTWSFNKQKNNKSKKKAIKNHNAPTSVSGNSLNSMLSGRPELSCEKLNFLPPPSFLKMNIVESCSEKKIDHNHPQKFTLNVNPRLPSKSIQNPTTWKKTLSVNKLKNKKSKKKAIKNHKAPTSVSGNSHNCNSENVPQIMPCTSNLNSFATSASISELSNQMNGFHIEMKRLVLEVEKLKHAKASGSENFSSLESRGNTTHNECCLPSIFRTPITEENNSKLKKEVEALEENICKVQAEINTAKKSTEKKNQQKNLMEEIEILERKIENIQTYKKKNNIGYKKQISKLLREVSRLEEVLQYQTYKKANQKHLISKNKRTLHDLLNPPPPPPPKQDPYKTPEHLKIHQFLRTKIIQYEADIKRLDKKVTDKKFVIDFIKAKLYELEKEKYVLKDVKSHFDIKINDINCYFEGNGPFKTWKEKEQFKAEIEELQKDISLDAEKVFKGNYPEPQPSLKTGIYQESSTSATEPQQGCSTSAIEPQQGYSTSAAEPQQGCSTSAAEPQQGCSYLETEPQKRCPYLETEPQQGCSTSVTVAQKRSSSYASGKRGKRLYVFTVTKQGMSSSTWLPKD